MSPTLTFDDHLWCGFFRSTAFWGKGVFCIEPQTRLPRQGAVHPTSGEPFEFVQSGAEQPDITAELVDHKTGDQFLVGGFEQGHRAVQCGKDPAPIDVTDHHHGHVRVPGQSHVDVVTGT